jgi:cardiolipin synthase A/B
VARGTQLCDICAAVLTHYLLSHLVAVLTAIASVVVTIHLLGTRRTPQSLLAWLLAVVFMPFVAIPLYLLLGVRKTRPRGKLESPAFAPVQAGGAIAAPQAAALQRVLTSAGLAPVRWGNRFELLADGQLAYASLLERIRSARRSIHFSFFILGDDATGRSLVEALAERARAGIEVRVILDAVGSARARHPAARLLAKSGGILRAFMPLLHVPLRRSSNLRSHRKLAIFDGEAVLTGGMNLALEYMGPTPLPERWRDIAGVVTGPVARDAEALFASDWVFCGGHAEELTLPPAGEGPWASSTPIQLVASGPDVREDALYDALVTALFSATQRAVVVTPYYVPDDTLQRAVLLAARRGVPTKIIVPAHSNHMLADFARSGLIRELRRAGVEVLAYTKGMLHAKAMVVDDHFAYLGSPNFDVRSLYLNFEDALFFYGAPEVQRIAAWIEALESECVADLFDRIRAERWLLERIARLASPEI